MLVLSAAKKFSVPPRPVVSVGASFYETLGVLFPPIGGKATPRNMPADFVLAHFASVVGARLAGLSQGGQIADVQVDRLIRLEERNALVNSEPLPQTARRWRRLNVHIRSSKNWIHGGRRAGGDRGKGVVETAV
jgi:hypothetical protein